MNTYSLILYPYGRQQASVALTESINRKDSIRQIINKETDVFIFSDLSYEFVLSGENISTVQKIDVYINDVYEPSVYNDSHIMFPNKSTSDRRIFLDCYGFVEITLIIYDTNGISYQYATNYLPVLVQRGELNEKVKAMVQYVYSNQEIFLLNGEPKAKNPSSLKDKGYQNLSAQIILAREIAAIYESNYSYFKANSRFKIDKVSKIDRFERLQYVTPSTVQFIVTHLGELRAINSNYGIRIGNQVYQPEKTLSQQNERSYDIYENRVMLGFIRKMIDSINELYTHCCNLLDQIPNNEDYNDVYIYSSFFMFVETRKMLEDSKMQLNDLRIKFTQLWTMYSSALNIQPEAMLNEPHPTRIFMSVPPYNCIFVQIHKWFQYGIYDFAKESSMLSLIKISSLYERYLLTKIIAYFHSREYELENVIECVYPMRRKSKYKNTNCDNTFIFRNDLHTITLYFQPVIYDTDESSINGIGLIRNNSIPVFTSDSDDNSIGGHYYSPDYIIKVENNSSTRYLIMDAKFSNLDSVKRYHVKDLAFKYLFSTSPINPTDSVVGLCLIYGKCDASEQLQSVYDKCLPDQHITPIAELLPLMEDVANEEHFSNLDTLLSMLIA